MRLTINLIKPEGPIKLPIHHNYYLQSFIYRYMRDVAPELSDSLHSEGFKVNVGKGIKRFKLFTFSRLNPRRAPKRQGGFFIYPSSVELIVCSPLTKVLEAFARGIVKVDRVRVADETLIVREVRVKTLKEEVSGPLLVRTLSPITVRETVVDETGKRRSIFLAPFSHEFFARLERNIKDKWEALTGAKADEMSFSVRLADGVGFRKSLLKYKNTVVEAWDGMFVVDGDPNLLRLALYAGLGERNSQGFGCIEVVKRLRSS